tara:strand:- start:871 stop:1233 length:363 start_codon:yes stop_codon:yes gene_type:complete
MKQETLKTLEKLLTGLVVMDFKKEAEEKIQTCLKEVKEAINYNRCSLHLPDEETIYVSHGSDGDDDVYVASTRSFNELEMLAEDLECVKMWLDDKKAPKTDINGNEYSVVGRIQCLLNVC